MAVLEFSDSVFVALDPESVYALVSDVTRIGEWSPVCRACWWDDPDAGPVAGAWFTGRNETPQRVWETRSQVVVADGRDFVWEVNGGWVRWGFAVAPEEGGTRLTEHWQLLPRGVEGFHERYGAEADAEIAERSAAAHSGIPKTLAAIKRTAEGGQQGS